VFCALVSTLSAHVFDTSRAGRVALVPDADDAASFSVSVAVISMLAAASAQLVKPSDAQASAGATTVTDAATSLDACVLPSSGGAPLLPSLMSLSLVPSAPVLPAATAAAVATAARSLLSSLLCGASLAVQSSIRHAVLSAYLHRAVGAPLNLGAAPSVLLTALVSTFTAEQAAPVPLQWVTLVAGCGPRGSTVPFVHLKPLFRALLATVSAPGSTEDVLHAARTLGCLCNREAKGAIIDDLVTELIDGALLPALHPADASPNAASQGT
jgi:hypothetical protein